MLLGDKLYRGPDGSEPPICLNELPVTTVYSATGITPVAAHAFGQNGSQPVYFGFIICDDHGLFCGKLITGSHSLHSLYDCPSLKLFGQSLVYFAQNKLSRQALSAPALEERWRPGFADCHIEKDCE